jgi:hypothetical protein
MAELGFETGYGMFASVDQRQEVQLLMSQRQQQLAVPDTQLIKYRTQRSFFFAERGGILIWRALGRDIIDDPDSVKTVNILGEAGGVGKTHALGELAARVLFDARFNGRMLRETGKPAILHPVNMTTAASDLALMTDQYGNPLIKNKAHSWEPIERERSIFGMNLAIERARERLPKEQPDFRHVIGAEYLVAFLSPEGVPYVPGSFYQFRLTDYEAQKAAGEERATFENPAIKPAQAYGEHGGEIDDPEVTGEILENRMGTFASMLRQREIVNRRLVSPEWYARLRDAGAPDFDFERLQDLDDQQERNYQILPVYYGLLMKDWGVTRGVNGFIVPNTPAEPGKKGYFYKAIEIFRLKVGDYVRAEEVIRAVG